MILCILHFNFTFSFNYYKILKIIFCFHFFEFLSAPITRPDSNESIKSLGRCSNPFYKNFENEL